MDSSGDFDDDPFSYKPLKRRKITSPDKGNIKTQTQKVSRRRTPAVLSKKHNPGPSGRMAKNPSAPPRDDRTLRDILEQSTVLTPADPSPAPRYQWCPLCQIPMSLLTRLGLSTSSHLAECQEGSERDLPPCSAGVTCNSQVVSHYARYDHRELARARDVQHTDKAAETRCPVEPSSPSTYLPNAQCSVGQREVPQAAISPSLPYLTHIGLPWTSTPSHRKYRSPVKVVRRNSVRTSPSQMLPEVKQVDFSRSDVMEASLVSRLKRAVERLDSEEHNIVGDISAVAGPSRVTGNRGKLMQETEQEERLGGGNVDPSLEKTSPVVTSPVVDPVVEKPSPIKVSADRDSQELELRIHIDPEVQCTRLRVRVPLKLTDSGAAPPVEVSTTYTDIKTPIKRNITTEPFSPLNNKENENNRDKDGLSKTERDKLISRVRARGFLAPDLDTHGDTGQLKKCPDYKKVQDTTLAVDVFDCGSVEGVTHYLLSHYHTDHYRGLSVNWNKPIVASSITKRMAVTFSKARADLFLTLDPGETLVVAGVEITAVDANHCPGSLMFVFRLVTGTTILHTGDCRAGPAMEEEPVFWNRGGQVVDKVYLDTTFCRQEYDFPPPGDVIDRTVDLVEEFLASHSDTAVLVGAYMIGKERIFKAVARHLDCKVWADKERVKTWKCLGDQEILNRRVERRSEARVQVVRQKLVNWAGLGIELDKLGSTFSHVLGIKSTGWAHSRGEGPEASLANLKVETRGEVSLLEVPYSEHSSFSELRRLIKFLRIKDPEQIIPLVNFRDLELMKKTFTKWIEERKNEGPDSQ